MEDITKAEIGSYSEESGSEDGFSFVQGEESFQNFENFQMNEFTDDGATSTDDESRPVSALSKSLEKVESSEKFVDRRVKVRTETSVPGGNEFKTSGPFFDSGMRTEDQLTIPPALHVKQEELLSKQVHELEDREFYDHHVDEEEPHPSNQPHTLAQSHPLIQLQSLNHPQVLTQSVPLDQPYTVNQPHPLNQPHPFPQLQSFSQPYPSTHLASTHPTPLKQMSQFQLYSFSQQPSVNPPNGKVDERNEVQVHVPSPLPPPEATQGQAAGPPPPPDNAHYQAHSTTHSSMEPTDGGNYTMEQLQVLNAAKSRQMAELKRQLLAQKGDSERHVAILREECGQLEKKKNELEVLVEKMSTEKRDAEVQLVSLKAELEVEATRNISLEASKNEFMARLVSAEATISGLKKQVVELGSSEALARVRESYTTAMAQAEDKHRQQLTQAMSDTQRVKEEMGAKDETIEQLNQELKELRKLLEDHTQHHVGGSAGTSTNKDGIIQQLKFESEKKKGSVPTGGEEEEEEGKEEDRKKRLVQLATQAEDLSYQVNVLTDELEYKQKQLVSAEDKLLLMSTQLSGTQGEIGVLNAQVSGLQRRLEFVQVNAESEKRQALEQCRMACVRLQDDSMQRLRQSFTAEIEKMAQDYTRQLTQARDDLTAFKEKYVALCGEKEEAEAKREAAEREFDVIRSTLEKVKSQLMEAEQEHTLQERKLQGEVVRLTAMLTQEARLEQMSRSMEDKESGSVASVEDEKLKEEMEDHRRELETLKKDVAKRREDLEAVEGKLLARTVELEAVQKQKMSTSAELESINVELEAKNVELKDCLGEAEAKKEELKTLGKEIESRNSELESVRRLVASVSVELEALRKDICRTEQEGKVADDARRRGEVERVRREEVESMKEEMERVKKEEMEKVRREETEKWMKEIEKVRVETNRVRADMELTHKEELDRLRREDTLVSVDRAVKDARVLWLKERDQLVHKQLENALGAARKVWLREREQLVRQQVEDTLKAARSTWVKERDELMKEQIRVAVAAAERSWEEHQRRGRRPSNNTDPTKSEQLQRMLKEAESRYKMALESAKEELCSRHSREKEALMQQLRQLEGRLGRVLKEREHERELECKRCGQSGSGQLEIMEARVKQVLEQWRANMTCSVKMLVGDVEKRLETYYEKRLEEFRREGEADKMKQQHHHQQQQLKCCKVTSQTPATMSWSSPSTAASSPREARRGRHTTAADRSSVVGGRGSTKVKSLIKDKRTQAKVKR